MPSEKEINAGAREFARVLALLSPDLLAGSGAADGVRIRADVLPASAWGSNLRGILSGAAWAKLREPVVEAALGRCQICGATPRTRRPDCHEQWAFGLRDEGEGSFIPVQHLVRLVALCPGCHAVQHVGLAGLRDQLDQVRARLARLNHWDAGAVAADLTRADQRFQLLEQVPWDLDLGVLAGQIKIAGFPDLYIPSGAREHLGHSRYRR